MSFTGKLADDIYDRLKEAIFRTYHANEFMQSYLVNLVTKTWLATIQHIYPRVPVGLQIPLQDIYVEQRAVQFPITFPRTNEEIGLVPQKGGACHPIRDALMRSNKLIVYGRPGAGKTILMRHIAYTCAVELVDDNISDELLLGSQHLPILVQLSDIANKNLPLRPENLSELCVSPWIREECPKDFFLDSLNNGNCIVLFDGMNEVPPNKRRDLAKQIVSIYSNPAYSNNHFIITSRPPLYGISLPGFYEWYLCDLTPREIDEWSHKWSTAIQKAKLSVEMHNFTSEQVKDAFDQVETEAEKKANDFIRKIDSSDIGVRRLAGNPLFLTLMYILYLCEKEVPERPVVLYEQCLNMLLTSWPIGRVTDEWAQSKKNPRTPQEKHLALESLAFWMHTNGIRKVSTDALIEMEYKTRPLNNIISEKEYTWENIKGFFKHAEHTLGLLVEGPENYFSFLHDSFRDYLVASHLRWLQEEGRILIIEHRHDADWQEVLLLYSGLTDTSKLTDEILSISKNSKDIFESDLFLAVRCLENAVVIQPNTQKIVIKKLTELFRKGKYQGLRDRAQESLICLGRTLLATKVIEVLEGLLTDDLLHVRARAALSLIQLEVITSDVIKVLIRLLAEKQGEIRENAVFAFSWLVKNQPERLEKELINLANSKDVNVVNCAITAIGWLGRTDSVVLDALINKLQDHSVDVRSRAVQTIEWLGCRHEKAINALVGLLFDKSDDVCVEAAFALGELGKTDSLVVIGLKQLLDNNNARLRCEAASALARLGINDREVINSLVNLLKNPDADVYARSIFALGELGILNQEVGSNPEVISEFVSLLSTKKPHVRRHTVAALASLASVTTEVSDNRDIVKALVKLVRDKDSRVRGYAVSSLSWMERSGKSDYKEALINWLANDEMSEHAAAALGQLRYADEPVLSELLDRINDDRLEVRRAVVSALGWLGQAVPKVISGLLHVVTNTEEDTVVRAQALQALGQLQLRDPDIIEVLEKVLLDNNSDKQVRWHAAFALGQLGWLEEAAIPAPQSVHAAAEALLESLDNKDNNIRLYGTYALGRLRHIDEPVIKSLVRTLGDDDAKVRSSAASALSELEFVDTDKTICSVLTFLNDKDENLAMLAAMALFISLRTTKQNTKLVLNDDNIIKLNNLLSNDKEMLHPMLNISIRVNDVAWWLLQEYYQATGKVVVG